MATVTTCIFLQIQHFPYAAAIMPLYSHLFGVCHTGYKKTWSFQGAMARYQTNSAMPSLGWTWV